MNPYKLKKSLEEMTSKDLALLASEVFQEQNYDDWDFYTDFNEFAKMMNWSAEDIVFQTQGEDLRGADVFTLNGYGNLECKTWDDLAEEALADFDVLAEGIDALRRDLANYLDSEALEALDEENPVEVMASFGFTCIASNDQSEMFSPAHLKYDVVLSRDGETLETTFQCNPDIHGTPTAFDVIYCILLDADSYNIADGDLDSFASEFGYDSVSKVIKVFEGCKAAAEFLEAAGVDKEVQVELQNFISAVENGEYNDVFPGGDEGYGYEGFKAAVNEAFEYNQAKDPATEPDELEELATSHHQRIRAAVAENPSTLSSALAVMAEDENYYIREAARNNPSYQLASLAERCADAAVVAANTNTHDAPSAARETR
jgi:hypothetical protein